MNLFPCYFQHMECPLRRYELAVHQLLNEAAAICEQMPAAPQNRFVCWIAIEEIPSGSLTCGGKDMTDQVLPCIAILYIPAGVLDGASRARYVELVHGAFKQAMPADDKRQLATSVVLHDVAEGTWGASGVIWRLPELAKAVGFVHLQSLVHST